MPWKAIFDDGGIDALRAVLGIPVDRDRSFWFIVTADSGGS